MDECTAYIGDMSCDTLGARVIVGGGSPLPAVSLRSVRASTRWRSILLLKAKLAAQDAATQAAIQEADGLFFFIAQLVRARLANGAMPKPPEIDAA
jgi:hypothetical protein